MKYPSHDKKSHAKTQGSLTNRANKHWIARFYRIINKATNRAAEKPINSVIVPLLNPRHSCILCNEPNPNRICPLCTAYFAMSHYACKSCKLPLKHHALYCGECLKQPPVYDDVFSAYLYQSPLSNLINDYKYKGHEFVGKGLATLFCTAIQIHYQQQHLQLPYWVVPIPLHWRRQWQRGFNQSSLLSQHLAKVLEIEHYNHARRIHSTPTQKDLSRKQRLKNLKGCFKANKALNGKSIAIVDDVMTTGATVNTFAQTLKDAGAGKITVWALARTPYN